MRRLLLVLSVLLTAPPSSGSEPCVLAAEERRWIESAIASWERTSRNDLGLSAAELPWMVFFDSRCEWHVSAEPSRPDEPKLQRAGEIAGAPLRSRAHGGTVILPDGSEIPPGITSFSSMWGAKREPFLTMALPSIWRNIPKHADDPKLEMLMKSVFVHEMTHTRQSGALNKTIDALQARLEIEEMDDDIVQKRFGDDVKFAESVRKERDLLYAAAHSGDTDSRNRYARAALTSIRQRRAAYFRDRDEPLAELEEIFLSMEGAANWAGYRAAVNEGLPADEAEAFMRRGGRFWSQDQGLALFLVADAIDPSWKTAIFGADPPGITLVISDALGPESGQAPLSDHGCSD